MASKGTIFKPSVIGNQDICLLVTGWLKQKRAIGPQVFVYQIQGLRSQNRTFCQWIYQLKITANI